MIRHWFAATRYCALVVTLLGAACANGGADGGGNANGGSAGASGNAANGGANNATSAGGASGNLGGASGSAGSTPGNGGTTGQGGTPGQGGSAGSSGATGAGGTIADAGPRGDGAPVCANADRTVVSIDPTGFVTRACNDAGLQGAWYCYTDGIAGGTSSCVTGRTPYLPASQGMCLSGTTSTGAGAYGAGIGFSLNDSGGTAAVKSAYNATMNNVVGFEITITGTTDVALRLNLTTAASSPDPAPFVALPGAGIYQVLFADAVVPGGWANANAGSRATPASIFDVQLAVPADPSKAANYNYCITHLKPILATTTITPAGMCGATAMYGGSVCGPQDLLGEVGNYAVQNNINAGSPGTQCVQAMLGGATCGGFAATFTGFGANGNTPSSYPSIIYGWQNGSFYGGYKTAKQLSAIGTATSSWSFASPASGKWDAAYDIWLSPQAAPKNAGGGTEVMVWLNYGGAAQPLGNNTNANVPIAGEMWEVWKGSVTVNAATWQYIAYRRPVGSSAPVTNLDLKAFLTNAASQNVGVTTASYLLGVQAGFEIWQSSQPATTSSFSATIN
jgi:hypothetical protein